MVGRDLSILIFQRFSLSFELDRTLPGMSESVPKPSLAPEPGADNARAHFASGLRAAQTGFPDRAAKEFEEAAWLDPENAEIQFNLGTSYLSMGLFEQALVNLSNAVRIRPDMPDAWGNRAVAYAALGEDGKSLADIDEAERCGGNRAGLETVIDYVKSRRKPKKA